VVSRTLNDPRPLACHRPAGPDDSPVLRAILGVPDGITDPVLTRRSCGGKSTPAATRCWSRWSWPASWATRAEQWRGWSTPRARALAMAARWLAERTPEQDRLAHIDVRSRGQHGACRP
jgi:hypothetical protein